MDLQNFYKAIGVNYNTVLRRLRREDLIEKYLKLFLKDQTFVLLAEAKENGDYQQLFGAAHTIKGLALNLELSPLADAASSLTEYLRNDTPKDNTIVDEKYEKLMTEYNTIRNLLQ